MTKKANIVHQVLVSADSGVTWTLEAFTHDTINNAVTITSQTDVMISYTSQNTPVSQADPLPVIEVNPKAIANNSHSIYKGAMLTNEISGKVSVGNGSNGFESRVLENAEVGVYDFNSSVGTVDLLGELRIVKAIVGNFTTGIENHLYKRIDGNSGAIDLSTQSFTFHTQWEDLGLAPITSTPQHSTINLDNSDSSASKRFDMLCVDPSNNEYCIAVVGEEGAYNALGYGWADDENNDFEQITNGSVLDFNGTTVNTRFAIKRTGKFKRINND
jgi:hypothetical protein